MRKTLLIIVFLTTIAILGFVTVSPSFAVCQKPLSVDPSSVPYNFKGNITLTSDTDCFNPGTEYLILQHPQAIDNNIQENKSFLGDRRSTSDPRKLITDLDVEFDIRGEKYPGAWIIRVCFANKKVECTAESNNVLSSGTITVEQVTPSAPPPTPTLRPDLPIISPGSQSQCGFPADSNITINNITNTQDGKTYFWWWEDEGDFSDSVKADNTGYLNVAIPKYKTKKLGKRKFCIDKSDALDKTKTCSTPNSLWLLFTAGPPSDDEKRCTGAAQSPVCTPGKLESTCTGGCKRPDTNTECPSGEGAMEFKTCNADGKTYSAPFYGCSASCSSCTSGCKNKPGPSCTGCGIMTTFSCDDIVGTSSDTSCFSPTYCGSLASIITVPTAIITPPPCKKWVDINDNEVATNSALVANGQARCALFDTAFGDIATDQGGLIKTIFTVILSLSGGIALLLIIYSGYQLVLSRGNPEKVQGAKETITSAIVGLLFIIFSVAILQAIGVEILRIPGFSR